MQNSSSVTHSQDIAVVGLALAMPRAHTSEEFWSFLKSGTDAVGNLSDRRRMDLSDYLRHTRQVERQKPGFGAFLDSIDMFDSQFFGIRSVDAGIMDPHQRIFLEIAWKSLEDAGCSIQRIRGSKTGVYLGFCGDRRYREILAELCPDMVSLSAMVNTDPIIAARLSYLLDLKGPNMLINTLCSSSLVAVHTACRALVHGECDQAVAGGIELHVLAQRQVDIGVHSSDGRTRAFDAAAGGTGCGEGAGAVVLKSLSRAIHDHDQIYAVIKGSAVNHDGNSIGLTAPNPLSQSQVIQQAWDTARIDPGSISYIEAHGTATKLGDPIEIEGLCRAFQSVTKEKQFCAIGSVKSNIGHLDGASGIAGLLKVILMLKHETFVPSLHFHQPNPAIDFENSPVYVNTHLRRWESDTDSRRRCGVSSFGLSGTNCHVVLEEAPKLAADETNLCFAVTVSAKTLHALRDAVRDLSAFLRQETALSIQDLSYTRNVRRDHYNYRIVFFAKNVKETADVLDEILKGTCANSFDADFCLKQYQASLKRHAVSIMSGSKADSSALRYLSGGVVDWEEIYGAGYGRTVHLPSYSMIQTRCWLSYPEKSSAESGLRDTFLGLIRDALAAGEISLSNNYIDLGGDSMHAIHIVHQLSSRLNIPLQMTHLLESETLADFYKYLVSCMQNKQQLVKLAPAPAWESYPLTDAQKRIFTWQTIHSGFTDYNMTSVTRVEGELDQKRLRMTLESLAKRHDILKTVFIMIDREPRQTILEPFSASIESIPAGNVSLNEIMEQFVRPFDLFQGPLFRAAVCSVDETTYLLFDVHHIICDGESINILLRDFSCLYGGEMLPAQGNRYVDFAVWQNSSAGHEQISCHKDFWLNRLIDWKPSRDEVADSLNDTEDRCGQSICAVVGPEFLMKLNHCATRHKATLFMLLLTVFRMALFKNHDHDTDMIGVVVSGRSLPELETVVGVFVNILPILIPLSCGQTGEELLEQVKKSMLDAYAHQDYPYGYLLKNLGDKLGVTQSITKVLFNMPRIRHPSGRVDGYSSCPEWVNDKSSKSNLMFNVYEEQDRLSIQLNYDASRFSTPDAVELLESFLRLLNVMLQGRESESIPDLVELIGHEDLPDTSADVRQVDFHFLQEEPNA